MAEWSLEYSLEDGGWHEYLLWQGSTVVSWTRWQQHGTDCELHSNVYVTRKSVIVKMVELFNSTVRRHMKQQGVTTIVTMSDKHDAKMQRFWELMGFSFFGEYNDGVHVVPFAVMEV